MQANGFNSHYYESNAVEKAEFVFSKKKFNREIHYAKNLNFGHFR